MGLIKGIHHVSMKCCNTAEYEKTTEMAEACKIDLTHEEWYKLYLSSGKFLP